MNTLLMLTLSALAARIALRRPARAMASDEVAPNPLQEAAEAGDREAMYQLGWALERRRGLPADPLKTASWYRLAADEGHDQTAAGLPPIMRYPAYHDESQEKVTVAVDTASLLEAVKARNPPGRTRHLPFGNLELYI
jgi:TPR repeat protein